MKPPPPQIRWEIDIPLATNPRLLKTLALVAGLAALIPSLFMSVILAAQGEWDGIPALAGLFALVGVGLFVSFVLIALIVFGNRLRTRYTLDAQGIHQETIDRTSRLVNRLTVLGGAASGQPGPTGAGLTARARESERLDWRGGFSLQVQPRAHRLIFRNAWRPLMEVYCTPENFVQIEALARHFMSQHHTSERTPARSPLPSYLGHSMLILLAAFILFTVHDEFDLDLFAPILVMAFALATLWLIPLFGYVVLLVNAGILASLVMASLEERVSYIRPSERYRHYEVFSDADWALLGFGLLALGYLSWLAWRAARGRLLSLLMRDQDDQTGPGG
ncbi:hypothetical protein [Allochromatium vinosum]|uniref:Uncharacterized protein n=1 Tax=Allochromatium vinosum (strain ATCC 17899 / DSM 180 / NBRC 103801 / NCIMB 10441 / D) TaxID=572477 RepID=D3RUS8_ALLVD|nr:hypothetical protein [Allochromatium vinosum]ADC60977.1 hypothetical protein Alvin_0005 [Allochromatium vinosum DSM 180]